MNKEKLLSLGLTEEQATEVLNGFEGYVPRERFNEVNEAKKRAEEIIAERDKQIGSLKKLEGGAEELKAKIEALQSENKAAREKYEADLKAMKIDHAIDAALTASGARNLKAARALLDISKVGMDGESVTGLEDQIKALVADEATNFMFKSAGTPAPQGTKPVDGSGAPNTDVSKMTYSERVAYVAQGGQL